MRYDAAPSDVAIPQIGSPYVAGATENQVITLPTGHAPPEVVPMTELSHSIILRKYCPNIPPVYHPGGGADGRAYVLVPTMAMATSQMMLDTIEMRIEERSRI